MTQRRDSNGELRAIYAMRLLEYAERSVQPETGPIGVIIRVALALIFMYLIAISYLMFGTVGIVFVSVLFLVAYFVPYLYQAVKGLFERRWAREKKRNLGRQAPLEG